VTKLVRWALGLYLLFAIIGRFVEGMGAVECGCAPNCWCKKPVLSTFRWAFPFGHQGRQQTPGWPLPWPSEAGTPATHRPPAGRPREAA